MFKQLNVIFIKDSISFKYNYLKSNVKKMFFLD